MTEQTQTFSLVVTVTSVPLASAELSVIAVEIGSVTIADAINAALVEGPTEPSQVSPDGQEYTNTFAYVVDPPFLPW
jgi:hypothetical protein